MSHLLISPADELSRRERPIIAANRPADKREISRSRYAAIAARSPLSPRRSRVSMVSRVDSEEPARTEEPVYGVREEIVNWAHYASSILVIRSGKFIQYK